MGVATADGPSLLSYKQYTEDKDYLAEWLADTSRQCGYQVESVNPSGPKKFRLERETLKEAKDKTTDPTGNAPLPKFRIRVADFTPIARAIANSEPRNRPNGQPSSVRNIDPVTIANRFEWLSMEHVEDNEDRDFVPPERPTVPPVIVEQDET
ncbi:hypothetical protein EJ02DRAFT_434129 [Clathrospora elynae]|uniref:DUF6604 domain-containing protein n=1 Tax=Clathrospora elynae TaxID=706981 RepID=A0A6A5SR79_9PLEO|nr:hypothetical protein EJ02DRAFT_434129 [Clathrospora elynae]